MEGLLTAFCLVLIIWLAMQRWFWVVFFFAVGLWAALSAIAYAVHFQIFITMAFVILTLASWGAAVFIVDSALRK